MWKLKILRNIYSMWEKNSRFLGGSSGLVVMGGDSCSEGLGFELRPHLLDGGNIISHIFVVRILMFVWKDEKEAEDGPFLKKKQMWKLTWDDSDSWPWTHEQKDVQMFFFCFSPIHVSTTTTTSVLFQR